MTRTTSDVLPLPWRPRSEVDLLTDQIGAIDAWNAARRAQLAREEASGAAQRSREARLDHARRTDVVRRQHEAVVARTEEHLRASAHLLRGTSPPRALLVHRDPWFSDRVCRSLEDSGVEVVCRLDNGADGVGAVVAEQPDLLLVEDRLPMLGGAEVLRQALPFSPRTVAFGQVQGEAGVAELVEAGARAAWSRRVPPDAVAAELLRVVQVVPGQRPR